MTKEEKSKLGLKSRTGGKYFEKSVREDLEKDGWIVIRNSNNVSKVDTDAGQSILFRPSKPKYNPFTKSVMMSNQGFPDFIIIQKNVHDDWLVRFMECKSGKYLSAEEKQKARWIMKTLKIPVYIAYKGVKRGQIVYEQVKDENR